MDGRLAATAIGFALGVSITSTPVHAINHATEYKTNMGNYRTCTDPLLESCGFTEVLSPSKFYLPNGTTTTVIHKDDGAVQLRIDSGGMLTDSGITYACEDQVFACTGGFCVGGRHNGDSCTANRCFGGSNEGAVCSSGTACPGGECSGGASCVSKSCQGGARDDQPCDSPGDLACTSVAGTSGWSVVFRGNQSVLTFTYPDFHYSLHGDDDAGCMKVCSFALSSSGAINSSGLSCSLAGTCNPLETFHYVELRDPDGEVVAIPTVGAAYVIPSGFAPENDPAKYGDCSRPSNAAFCP